MSRSQETVLALGIIGIIVGAMLAVSGMIAVTACSVLFGSPELASSVEGYSEDTGGKLLSAAAMTVFAGIFDIIVGILSVRAAKDADRIGPVCAVSVISLILSAAYAILCAVSGGLGFIQIAGLIFAVALVVCAFSIRKQKDPDSSSIRQ